MNSEEPLFLSDPQLAFDVPAESGTAVTQRTVMPVARVHDQLRVGYGDHDLIPDDEGSVSRVVQLHSADKDYYAYRYADIVSSAMHGKFGAHGIWWIELFSGPGRLFVAPEERFTPGSPVRALEVRRPYDGYVFNDLDLACIRALEPRVLHRGSKVHLRCGDANSPALVEHLIRVVPKHALVVLYGDPAGLDLKFETLARLAQHFPHLDLLLNFPVKGIIRALRGEAAAAVNRAADVSKARAVLDHPNPMQLLAGPNKTWGPSIRQWFENRLRPLAYEHFSTEVIKLYKPPVGIYDLMIASRNARAVEFFGEAVKKGPGGQYSLLG